MNDEKRERIGAGILSAVAGFVDTAGFIALFGLFTAHVTGNLVTTGSALAFRTGAGVVARLAMIPIFMASVAFTSLAARWLRKQKRSPLGPLLGAMTFALAIFGIAGVVLKEHADGPDSWGLIVVGGAGVVAMGIQNALMREALGALAPTTVMTGNVTQFTMDLLELVHPSSLGDADGGSAARAAVKKRLGKFGVALLGFVAGAALGTWLTVLYGLRSVVVPTFAVAFLTIVELRSPTKTK